MLGRARAGESREGLPERHAAGADGFRREPGGLGQTFEELKSPSQAGIVDTFSQYSNLANIKEIHENVESRSPSFRGFKELAEV